MTVRATMSTLIAQLRTMLNDDTLFTDQQLQDQLDSLGSAVQILLVPRAPAYTLHLSGGVSMEDGALVYAVPGIIFPGWTDARLSDSSQVASDILIWWLQSAYTLLTPLVLGTDYTIDSATGRVTTPTADRRGLLLVGTSYNLDQSASAEWEQIASRYVGMVDIVAGADQAKTSQLFAQAKAMSEIFGARGSGSALAL